MPSISELRVTERSPQFEEYRMNRKIIGAFRYGLLGAEGKQKWNRIPDMIRRLKAYQKDRNCEHLVDVANLCECEFVEGDGIMISKDDGEHTQER